MTGGFDIQMRVGAHALVAIDVLETLLESEGRQAPNGWHVRDAEGRAWGVETHEQGGAVVFSPTLTEGDEPALREIVATLRRVASPIYDVAITIHVGDDGAGLADMAHRVQVAFE